MELTPHLHAFLWTSPHANNCNTYLIRSPQKTILIDPGHAAYFDHVRQGLVGLGLTADDVDLVICTHAHPDHIEAMSLFDRSSTLFALHEAEWRLVEEMGPYLPSAMNVDPSSLAPDFFLQEGELAVDDITLEVYHTPGHAPGAVTLLWPAEKALFSGDLIFKDGLGRTDLPGGDGRQLKASIQRMAGLDAAWLLSGHGGVISGAAAVRKNFERVERTWFGYV
jgi:glyoxylase-like metal-dependent hydrolase (beta-lactamase superfamily II)